MYIQSTCIKRLLLAFLDIVMFATVCKVTITLDKDFEVNLYTQSTCIKRSPLAFLGLSCL